MNPETIAHSMHKLFSDSGASEYAVSICSDRVSVELSAKVFSVVRREYARSVTECRFDSESDALACYNKLKELVQSA